MNTSLQRYLFIGFLLLCIFFIIAAYSYRAFIMLPQLPTTQARPEQQTTLVGGATDEQSNGTEELADSQNTQVADSQAVDSQPADSQVLAKEPAESEKQGEASGIQTNDAEYTPQIDSGVMRQQVVFDDVLPGEWDNWSWETTVDLRHGNVVSQGETSISVTFDSAWAALWLSSSEPIYRDDYDLLRFWIHGGEAGGQSAKISLADGNQVLQEQGVEIAAQANQWTLIDIPLTDLGAGDEISGVSWQDASGQQQPSFYIDQISFVKLDAAVASANANLADADNESATAASGPQIRIDVDVNRDRQPISPDIYGINYGDDALVSTLNHSIRRWGGNATTRYNWRLDVSNRASDWFFENVPEEVQDAEALPKGSSAERFITQNQAAGVKTIMTMPMIGWTPKSRDFACSFAVSKYGQQQYNDQWNPDCGNGYTPNGEQLVADPTDTSIAIDAAFVTDWIGYLVQEFGSAANGGVTHYNLDNEPMLWHETHRDVHPEPVSYDEIYERTVKYAAAIKRADPSAQTLGPAVWGWSAYQFSALDLADGGSFINRYPDRAAHGDMPFLEWYLMQMAAYEQANGVRILDYLDVHYYPQAQEVALAPKGSPRTRALRLRSTRSLWDDTYVDESWIDEPVRLIPRLREWIDAYYPGTKIALSEYNWGALDDINGALAQAEVLGIFGREGVDLATMWAPEDADDPFVFAFQMYRNYDGNGNAFGETSVYSSSSDSEQLSVYSAQKSSNGALTVLVINKSDRNITGSINVANFAPADIVQRYRYSGERIDAIQTLPESQLVDGQLSELFPNNSFTLLVFSQPQ